LRGLLADEAAWYVTDDGRQVIDKSGADVMAFAARHGTLRRDALFDGSGPAFFRLLARGPSGPRLCSRTMHRRWRASMPRAPNHAVLR